MIGFRLVARKRTVLCLGRAFVAAALACRLEAASFPPELRFRSVSTDRVTVHFHQGLEATARTAAALATEILASHEERYHHRVGHVHIVVADVQDGYGGLATPLPYPLVRISAVAPNGSDELGNHDGWLRLVLVHELAHVVHLDQARGLLRAGRRVFGRAPFLFPNLATPTWMIEGLATYEETQETAFGRGRNPDSRMVLRVAALEGGFLKEDEAVLGLDRWPGGQASYLFGEAFLRDLTEHFGEETLPELARVHSGRPVPYIDDLTSKKVTGASFHTRWRAWSEEERAAFQDEVQRLTERGLTPSRALTRRGVRQVGPRFSPDGAWIAYTNRNLTRFRAIHVVRPDGSGDRKLTHRNGGTSLTWSPDGRTIVYDEPEVHRLFATRSDLRAVDVARGRARRLTRGLRAREPDFSPDGRDIVFVRQRAEGSDLAVIHNDGSGLRDLTRSGPGVEWSSPRWSPAGDAIAASRWTTGGWLDIVRVDAQSGDVTPLTQDRAKDVEPAFSPDGTHVIFRSDRDGVSNLYGLRLEDGALLRVSNVLGGAFSPDLGPGARSVTFASYSSRGYDIHIMDLDLQALSPAEAFADPYPAALPLPAPVDKAERVYRPLPTMLPRFWSPYVGASSEEARLGVVTAGADPLLRHVYGLDFRRGLKTDRFSFQGFYQYDRFRPTLLLAVEDETDAGDSRTFTRTRELNLRASFPLRRRVRSSQSLSLAWRREREELVGGPAQRLDRGGLEAAWSLSTVKQYPYSISAVDGYRLRFAYLKEDPAFGSEISLSKLTADGRAYLRLFGEGDVLALRWGGGTTLGRPGFRQSFAVGGFPDRTLLDLVRTNLSVLRGYRDDAFRGRKFVHANAEYRFPLAHPQRGVRSLPVFLRHLHGAIFADAAHAWSGDFRVSDVKTGAGAALGADLYLGHVLPVTGTLGVARGLARGGETRFYFRAGLSF